MRIWHHALSHLTCRIGGCLVPLEHRTTEHQEETLTEVSNPLDLLTGKNWQLRCSTKDERPL